MVQRRVLMIGLDGFDIAFAERLIDQGMLPHIGRLRGHSARFDLDHGIDKYSGLAWEHVSAGLSPGDGARWSALTFDPSTYAVRQETTSSRPFMADLSARTVIFDVPYFDLTQAPQVLGLTHWGSHDPGVSPASRPAGLRKELDRRFGPYPATQWIYGFCWPSAAKSHAAGAALVRAVEVRAEATRWLLSERLPEWDLALVVVSEPHCAIEPLWHGVDPSHPLHGVKSSAAAGEALHAVYRAIDDLIGNLQAWFPDVTLAVFAMHGMGPNDGDVPAMVLLPELLYRASFGKPYLRPLPYAGATAEGAPLIGENASWEDVMLDAVPKQRRPPGWPGRLLDRISHLGRPRVLTPVPDWLERSGVAWMPAARYGQFWSQMPAFALPAYYDGRVRINLRGREACGTVAADHYDGTCEEMIRLIRDCRDLLTGQPAVAEIHRPKRDPHAVGPSEADLYVVWKSAPLGFTTPRHGNIGPVPYRRTGGHTGSRGFLYMAGAGIAPGEAGAISSFDVIPTVVDLLGEARPAGMSGVSAAARLS